MKRTIILLMLGVMAGSCIGRSCAIAGRHIGLTCVMVSVLFRTLIISRDTYFCAVSLHSTSFCYLIY